MSPDVLAPIVNFLVVVFILVYFGRKPLVAFFATRSETVSASMKEAEVFSRQALADYSKWQKSFQDKDAHIRQMEEDSKSMVAKLKERTEVHAKNESERIKKDATLMATSETQKASEKLQNEVVAGSLEIAEKYLAQHMPATDRAKLVEQYVELVRNGSR